MGKFINPNINLMERINIINPIKAEYIRLGWVYFYIVERWGWKGLGNRGKDGVKMMFIKLK